MRIRIILCGAAALMLLDTNYRLCIMLLGVCSLLRMPTCCFSIFSVIRDDRKAQTARNMQQAQIDTTAAHFLKVNAEEPNEFNKKDTEEEQVLYRLVSRWMGPLPSSAKETKESSQALAKTTSVATVTLGASSPTASGAADAKSVATPQATTVAATAVAVAVADAPIKDAAATAFAYQNTCKPNSVYFPEQVMMSWRFKTTALDDELNLHESKLENILHLNPPSTFTAVFRDKSHSLDKFLTEAQMAHLWRMFLLSSSSFNTPCHGVFFCVLLGQGDVESVKASLAVALTLVGDMCVWVFELGRALTTEKLVYMKVKRCKELVLHLNYATVCEPGLHEHKQVPIESS